MICDLRNADKADASISNLIPENLFLGVGSDECIDALIRCFCVPGKDKLLTCPPTYGMYSVSAKINDVEVVKVNLDLEAQGFPLRPKEVSKALIEDSSIKVAYFCSPGNPTAGLLNIKDIETILNHPTWNGIVVVDEAYIDFSPVGSSMAPYVNKYPNLVVLQTLSKSFGLAAIRLGISYGSVEVTQLFNNMKAPYNISTPSSLIAERALSPESVKKMRKHTKQIIQQRERIVNELPKIKGIGKIIGGLDANFLLFQILDKEGKPSSSTAEKVYTKLAEVDGVVIRYRGNEPGCSGGIRATVGTKEENDVLLRKLTQALAEINGN